MHPNAPTLKGSRKRLLLRNPFRVDLLFVNGCPRGAPQAIFAHPRWGWLKRYEIILSQLFDMLFDSSKQACCFASVQIFCYPFGNSPPIAVLILGGARIII